jgi:hypothetical protein
MSAEGGFRRKHDDLYKPGTGGHGRDFRRGELMQLNAALNDYIERRGILTPLEQSYRVAIQKKNAARAAQWRAKQ